MLSYGRTVWAMPTETARQMRAITSNSRPITHIRDNMATERKALERGLGAEVVQRRITAEVGAASAIAAIAAEA